MSYKYFEIAEELEQKVAAGTADYSEKQMAARLGIPVPQMAYKDRGNTYRSFKAANVDTGKLTKLVGALKDLGVSVDGFAGGSSPEKQMDTLVSGITSWLEKSQPAPAPATSMGNSKSSGGAGASSKVPSYGGPKAGPNPPKNQAAQKEAQAYSDIASALLKPPPYYDRSRQ